MATLTSTPERKVRDTSRVRDGHASPQGTMVAGKFRLMKWLRLHGFDIVTMILMGGMTIGVHLAPGSTNTTFPLYNLDGSIMRPDLAYPRRNQIIPTWLSAIISILGPMFFFALFQWRRRSADDFLTTTLGLLKSIVAACLAQAIIKSLIGGLRPHFLDICKPDIGDRTGLGFHNVMFDPSFCTGGTNAQGHLREALKSMPSGHATVAWAGLLFLALYFNAQLKVISGHNPAYWKTVLFFIPLLGALLISLTLIKDHHHHWQDVIVGTIIGCTTALVAFRQTFAAVWDYRFNHILLPRATSLFHRRPYLPIVGRGAYYTYQPIAAIMPQDLPVAREGGWGYGIGEHTSGAPGDATVLATSNFMGGGGGAHPIGTDAGFTTATRRDNTAPNIV